MDSWRLGAAVPLRRERRLGSTPMYVRAVHEVRNLNYSQILITRKMEVPKYEYHLKTWGGFYNNSNAHGFKEGDYWFDTAGERRVYIDALKKASEFSSPCVISVSEGYHCRVPTKLHWVVEWDGKRYYSEYELFVNYPFSTAQYHLEHKWYPGFNDYPLGEDFDYDKNKVTIIQEWITGSFSDLNDD